MTHIWLTGHVMKPPSKLDSRSIARKLDTNSASLLSSTEASWQALKPCGGGVEFSQAELAKTEADIAATDATYQYRLTQLVLSYTVSLPK